MTISQWMTHGRAVGQRLALGSVAVLAFTIGTAFGAFAHDTLPFSASQRQPAPRTMAAAGAADPAAAAGAAGARASSPWELYRCDGCPDVAGIVRYFTGTTPIQGPWELNQCDGCPDAASVPQYHTGTGKVK